MSTQVKLQSILDSLTDEIALLDSSGRIVTVNEAWKSFCRRNGGDAKYYVGANYLEVCRTAAGDSKCGSTAIGLEMKMREVLNGTIQELVMEYPCHSDTWKRWFSMKASHLNHGSAGAVVLHANITERRLTESAFLHNEEKLNSVMNATVDSIVMTDPRGVIDNVNCATEKLFAYEHDELLGEKVATLIWTGESLNPVPWINQLLHTKVNVGNRHEIMGMRKDKTIFPAHLFVKSNAELGVIVFVFRDISEKRNMQHQALDVIAAEQSRVGHELHDGTQQELTGLSIYAELVHELLETATSVDKGDGIQWSLKGDDYQNLRGIANKLLEGLSVANQRIEKLSRGVMPIQIEARGLSAALKELAINADPRKKFRFRFEGDASIVTPNIQIATNLYRIAQQAIHNSMMHSRGDQVTIRLFKKEDEIVLEICDNGVGFDHADSLRSWSVTRGIGLRSMDYRANSIGGALCIESSKSGGTTVRCTVSGSL